jgi:phage tail-like protein
MSTLYRRDYDVPLRLRSQLYPFAGVVLSRTIKSIVTINDGCLSLLVEETDGKFYLYFPYITPEEWREISPSEAQRIRERVGVKTQPDEMPPIDKKINVLMYDTDCRGNVWVLSTGYELYHFTHPHRYKSPRRTRKTFRSGSALTLWTHLYIDAEIPEGTKVVVKITDGKKSETYVNATRIYLYGFTGDFLLYQMALESNEAETLSPTIYSVTVVSDKKSYMDSMPAYYKEGLDASQQPVDPETLYRFLAIFQEIMEQFEGEIEQTHKLLLPALCESDYLEWLSSLLGIARDHRWEEERWRNFLSAAPKLYRGLGTQAAMEEAIYLYCGERPEIRRIGPFEFCVELPASYTEEEADREVIESIIWAFKPAHTVGRLYRDYAGNRDQTLIVGESVLPYNTQIE